MVLTLSWMEREKKMAFRISSTMSMHFTPLDVQVFIPEEMSNTTTIYLVKGMAFPNHGLKPMLADIS